MPQMPCGAAPAGMPGMAVPGAVPGMDPAAQQAAAMQQMQGGAVPGAMPQGAGMPAGVDPQVFQALYQQAFQQQMAAAQQQQQQMQMQQAMYMQQMMAQQQMGNPAMLAGMTPGMAMPGMGVPGAVGQQPGQSATEGKTFSGQVIRFDENKGFGFIDCKETKEVYGRDIIMLRGFMDGLTVSVGDIVTFKVEDGDRGPKAIELSITEKLADKLASLPTYWGKVKRVDSDRGLGFIDCEETKAMNLRDILMVKSQLGDDFPELGAIVSFNMIEDSKGGKATNVKTHDAFPPGKEPKPFTAATPGLMPGTIPGIIPLPGMTPGLIPVKVPPRVFSGAINPATGMVEEAGKALPGMPALPGATEVAKAGSPTGGKACGKAGKPQDWTCGFCGANNFSYRQACFKCGAPRAMSEFPGGPGPGAGKGGAGDAWTGDFGAMMGKGKGKVKGAAPY